MSTTIRSVAPAAWDRTYQLKVQALMTIGFGFVGLDRFIINPLFPVIQKELGLNYQDGGLVSVVLALAWGVASAFSGPLADRYGAARSSIAAVKCLRSGRPPIAVPHDHLRRLC
jgi:MFS family permease